MSSVGQVSAEGSATRVLRGAALQGGCWVLSWETGLQSVCFFFFQKSPHGPDLRALELPPEPGDSDKPVALTMLGAP